MNYLVSASFIFTVGFSVNILTLKPCLKTTPKTYVINYWRMNLYRFLRAFKFSFTYFEWAKLYNMSKWTPYQNRPRLPKWTWWKCPVHGQRIYCTNNSYIICQSKTCRQIVFCCLWTNLQNRIKNPFIAVKTTDFHQSQFSAELQTGCVIGPTINKILN